MLSPKNTDQNSLFTDYLNVCFVCSYCGLLSQSTIFQSGPKVIKLFSCSTQLRLKFILLIYVKMQTTFGMLTFISKIIYWL